MYITVHRQFRDQHVTSRLVEAPIPDQDSIHNLLSTVFSISLGLNLDQAGTNSAMTHVMVLSAKVRRSEWVKTSDYSKL